jgi:hypothetical protein
MSETITHQRQREEYEQEKCETATIIDAMPDDEIAGHVLMRAASNPNLLWTLALNPRTDPGLRGGVAIRVRAGLGPADDIQPVKQADGSYRMVAIKVDAIERAKRIKSGAEPMPQNAFRIYKTLAPKQQTKEWGEI